MASDDPNSGLLPLLEPDQDSRVSTLPGGRGGPGGPMGGTLPPPPSAGSGLPPPPHSGAHRAAAGPPSGLDPTAALAASLARVADQAEHALVDLAPAPQDDGLLTMEAVVAEPEPEPAAAPPPDPVAPEALELDLDRAGISQARGMAAPGDSVNAAGQGPSPAASVASAPAAARSPDVRPEGRAHLLGADPLARGLFALAVGLLLALPVAREAARRLDRDRVQPLLEELEESAQRPLAARAGTVRSLDAIGSELEVARGEVRGRFLLVWAGVGLALGGGLFVVPRPG